MPRKECADERATPELPEIIVTATKRATNEQETPATIRTISGETLANFGSWSALVLYERPATEGMKWYARTQYQHVGASWTDFNVALQTTEHLDQYDMVNFGVGLHGGRWEFGALVENVGNKLAIVNAYNTAFANFDVRTRPRTIGLQGKISF